MIGYKIGSQSISKQTENQIREEANKLVDKDKLQELVQHLLELFY